MIKSPEKKQKVNSTYNKHPNTNSLKY